MSVTPPHEITFALSPNCRDEFIAKNGPNISGVIDKSYEIFLSKSEAIKIADAIDDIVIHNDKDWVNPYLRQAIFEHYSFYPIRRPSEYQALKSQFANFPFITITYTLTTTYINALLDLGMTPSTMYEVGHLNVLYPKDGLATMLVHEIIHFNWNNRISQGLDSGRTEEGCAYGIEYFFTRHRSKGMRAQEIMETAYTEWMTSDTSQYYFCKWYFVMKWYHDAIKIHKDIISPEQAKRSIALLIIDGEGGTSYTNGIIWAEEHLKNNFNFIEDKPLPVPGLSNPTKIQKRDYIRDHIAL